jgi:hypothetical protein
MMWRSIPHPTLARAHAQTIRRTASRNDTVIPLPVGGAAAAEAERSSPAPLWFGATPPATLGERSSAAGILGLLVLWGA